MFILIIYCAIIVVNTEGKLVNFKKSKIDTSLTPQNINTNYDISLWINQLHLETCAIVEIGYGFCSLFLEESQSSHNNEYFLGICQCSTISTWQLCSSALTKQRPNDCTFKYENFQDSRVHRRFCDIMLISEWGKLCNCSQKLNEKKLNDVYGFPTCFKSPLPKSICSPLNPCGTEKCETETLMGGVYRATCYKNCFTKQPFCEKIEPDTAKSISINSSWSMWDCPSCSDNENNTIFISTSKCLNKNRYVHLHIIYVHTIHI